MAARRLVLLLGFLLIASSSMPMAESKPKKNRDSRPKLPEPHEPLVAFQKFSVEIHNDLKMYLLDSHCYSKDDDLGLHVLYPDEQQNWSFEGNWLGTTDFHCRLEWERGFQEFDAFYDNADFLTNYCANSTCVWSARQDGIYLTNQDLQPVFYLYWEMLRARARLRPLS